MCLLLRDVFFFSSLSILHHLLLLLERAYEDYACDSQSFLIKFPLSPGPCSRPKCSARNFPITGADWRWNHRATRMCARTLPVGAHSGRARCLSSFSWRVVGGRVTEGEGGRVNCAFKACDTCERRKAKVRRLWRRHQQARPTFSLTLAQLKRVVCTHTRKKQYFLRFRGRGDVEADAVGVCG